MRALKLVGLVRVSSDGQVGDEGEGLDRQRATIRELATQHGAVDTRIVEIRAVSGPYVADTPEWSQVVRPLISRGWHVAVDSLDRLIRADSFDFRVYQDIRNAGALLYLTTGIQDFRKPSDVLFSTILGAFGGYEKEEIKRKMTDGRIAARKRGEWAVSRDRLPPGITYDKDTKTFGIEPVGAAKVRQVFQWIADGRSVLGATKEYGVKSTASVIGWVRNPLYRGYLSRYLGAHDLGAENQVFGAEGQPDPIVPEPLWRAANARLDANAKAHRKRRDKVAPTIWASTYLYSSELGLATKVVEGAVRLDIAAAPRHIVYGRSPKHGKATITYQCACLLPNARAGGEAKCGLRPLKAERVNQALDRYLTEMTQSGDTIGRIKATLTEGSQGIDADRARVQQALQKLDRKEENLVELRLEDKWNPAILDKKKAALDLDRERLEGELEALEKQRGPQAEDLDRMAQEWAWDASWSPQQKRGWLAKYVPRGIFVSNWGIESVSIRIPDTDGMVAYSAGLSQSWDDLIGITARASVIGPKKWPEGTCGTSAAAERLGVTSAQLAKWASRGFVPKPERRSQRHLAWTAEDINAAREALVAAGRLEG